jgi:formate hydrogenlyase subunit 3/multisubunit Na+/H+ antiporter MnhD subunit
MLPEENQLETGVTPKFGKRPFSCKVILAIVLTYFLVLTLLFLAALVYYGEIIRIMENYFDPQVFEAQKLRWFIIIGTILFSFCSAGLILQSFRRRGGFYLFFSSALVILTLDLIFLEFDWFRYIIQSGLIFLTGMVHFSKRCYTGKPEKIRQPRRSGDK